MPDNTHKLITKIQRFREESLPEMGISWTGADMEFVIFLHEAIPMIPDERIRDAMHRYYILNETQQRDELGRTIKEDAMFYQHLQDGRKIIGTLLRIGTLAPNLIAEAKVDVYA